MNYCQNCGSTCEDSDLICKTCGTILQNSEPPVCNSPVQAQPTGGPEKRPYTEHISGGGNYQPGNAQNYGGGAGSNAYNTKPGYGYPNADNLNGGYNNHTNPYGPRPPVYGYYNTIPRNNGFAIASMVLGIVGAVMSFCYFLGIFPAILAIIFGFVSKGAIKKSNGAEGGKAMATAGLVLGIVTVATIILIIAVLVILALLGIFDTNSSLNNFGFRSGQTYST